jgi:CDP-paratose synthetase
MKKLQTVLLTGATGFLGSHLLNALLSKGYKVVILKRSTSDIWRIKDINKKFASYDVDTQPIELAFKEQHIDAVIHTACHYGRNAESMTQIFESNLIFGLRIIDECLKFNIGTFINTDTLLQKHLNIYSLSKKQFVECLKQASKFIQIANLKLEHIYGPKDDATKFVPWVLTQLEANVSDINLTLGEQERDFIYIDDVVSAYLTVLEKSPGLTNFIEFDVGTGKLVSVKSFLQNLKKIYEDSFGLRNTKLNFGAIPYRDGEMMTVEINNQKLIDLGWFPLTNVEHGLKKTIKDKV